MALGRTSRWGPERNELPCRRYGWNSACAINGVHGVPWLPFERLRHPLPSGRCLGCPISERALGLLLVRQLSLFCKLRILAGIRFFRLLMGWHFNVVCGRSKQTLRDLTWFLSVVHVKFVDDWSNTATNRSEITTSCCGVSVRCRRDRADFQSSMRTPRSRCGKHYNSVCLSVLVLTVPISGFRCPTVVWQGTVRGVRVPVVMPTCA